ncbi:lectin subunit alpha-like [Cochliomyia hominivorax]
MTINTFRMTVKIFIIFLILSKIVLTFARPNKIYYIENEQFLDWHKANEACLRLGMNLLTIESRGELEYLKQYIKIKYGRIYPYWLGAYRINGKFEWIASGEEIKEFFWHKGEPNDKSGNENCIHTWENDFDWNDNDCERELPFICETSVK